MAIGSQDELIEEDRKMNGLLIKCFTMFVGCDKLITSMTNLERMVVVMMVVARVGKLVSALRFANVAL